MGKTIPAHVKCPMDVLGSGKGDNKSPAMSWTGGSADAKSYAIVLYDTRFSMLHWVLWDIPASVHELPEGLGSGYELSMPMGAHQVSPMNPDGHSYLGPCSTGGTYEYRLYSLKTDKLSSLTMSSTGPQAQMAVESMKIDMAIWGGTTE
jgi:Raf kinase inhibitor-like YbhB/YbcL family protein